MGSAMAPCAGVKMLNPLPGEYGRKAETSNWRGSTATGGACGLIDSTPENSPRPTVR